MTNQELKTQIREELTADGRLSAHPIEVRVEEELVVLSGRVQSYRRKLAAEQIAQRLARGRRVVNQLAVEPSAICDDEEVASHARALLGAHADIVKEAITVSASGGKVTLAGAVGSSWERLLAEDVCRSARGVRDVINLLVVDPFDAVGHEQASRQIEAAMSRADGLAKADIRVAVSDAGVVLSGEVEQRWQRDAAQAVAERFRPVHLQNDIGVRRSSGITDGPPPNAR